MHVRRKFLEYFRSEDHLVLPSSSVRPPASDPSLSFVNAGMNQWKGVFQGSAKAPAPRVAAQPTRARLLLDTLPPKNMMARRWCSTSSR